MLKNLAYLSAFTTFVVLVWVTLSIYNSIHSSTISKVESTQIVPLNPNFNSSVITALQNRIQVPVDLAEQITSSQSAKTSINGSPVGNVVLPSPTPNPIVIPSPTIPIASQSAGNSSSAPPSL